MNEEFDELLTIFRCFFNELRHLDIKGGILLFIGEFKPPVGMTASMCYESDSLYIKEAS